MKKAKFDKGKYYAAALREGSAPRLRKVAEVFSNHKFDRVLDVGCGDGSFSLLLKEASSAREIYGIEVSPEGTELANKAGVKAFCLDLDAEDFPFEDNFFNAVFCGEIIEHLYDPDHLLEEAHRVLKPEGLLVLSTPNMAWWLSRIALLVGFYPFGLNPSLRHPVGHLWELKPMRDGTPIFAGHVYLFTLSALLKLLKMHAFTVHSVTGIRKEIPPTVPLSKLFNLIDSALGIVPYLSFRFVVCCTKEKGDDKSKQSSGLEARVCPKK